jgi:hypothetical protein
MKQIYRNTNENVNTVSVKNIGGLKKRGFIRRSVEQKTQCYAFMHVYFVVLL